MTKWIYENEEYEGKVLGAFKPHKYSIIAEGYLYHMDGGVFGKEHLFITPNKNFVMARHLEENERYGFLDFCSRPGYRYAWKITKEEALKFYVGAVTQHPCKEMKKETKKMEHNLV